MKHIVTLVQKWKNGVGLAVVCGSISLALCLPGAALAQSGTSVSQLQFLQLMVMASGDASQFTASSTAADYVQWAKNNGMIPDGGLQPSAQLSKQALAQMLVQFLGINPKKKGGDYERILAREGIALPTDLSRLGLSRLFDDAAFRPRVECSHTSPTKHHGNNGVGNGEDPPPPGWVKNHPGREQNDGPGTSPGNPNNKQHRN
jgi:hypothetical protein